MYIQMYICMCNASNVKRTNTCMYICMYASTLVCAHMYVHV